MNMKRLSYITVLLLSFAWTVSAQSSIKVEAPDVVALDEQFNVTFIIEGEKNPSNFSVVRTNQAGAGRRARSGAD